MALKLLAANNAQAVLSAGISSSATTLTVNTGAGALFPAPVSGTSFYKLTLVDAATGQLTEVLHVTARSGDTMTVLRAQEGTTARAWSANDIAANMMTSGTLSFFAQNESPTFTGTPLAPTPTTGDSTTKLATTAFVANSIAANTGRLINIQVFTSSGTYTPTTGTKKIRVRLVGGGAGGGSAASNTSANWVSLGSGGGAGTYGETGLIDASSISTVTVIVGNGGAGGTVGGSGIAGGSSSFGAYITAPGGAAGGSGSSNAVTTPVLIADSSATGNCTGTNVLVNIPGGGSLGQIAYSGATGQTLKGSAGGNSFTGIGGGASQVNTVAKSGSGYGSGGAGGVAAQVISKNAAPGGDGASGIVIVEEYA